MLCIGWLKKGTVLVDSAALYKLTVCVNSVVYSNYSTDLLTLIFCTGIYLLAPACVYFVLHNMGGAGGISRPFFLLLMLSVNQGRGGGRG